VRKLKGPGRPIVPQKDRAAVLRALRSVDAVVVFDEDTPVRLMRDLKPNVYVKGGDHLIEDLPEAEVAGEIDGGQDHPVRGGLLDGRAYREDQGLVGSG
jgi:D-beta-D-heptose 7-phosphate kinase / D-beta-D-heptose 1-phosphate adenosyltransferase